jgi:hypothetical protein
MKNMRLLFVLLFTLVASFHLRNVFAAGVTTPITGEETVHPGASGSTGAVGGFPASTGATGLGATASTGSASTGGFVDQPKASFIRVNSINVTSTPTNAVDISCGIFRENALAPTADEVYQNTGSSGAAVGSQNGPVVAVLTLSNRVAGKQIGCEIEGLSANTTYALYCATDDRSKVLSDKVVFTTRIYTQGDPEGKKVDQPVSQQSLILSGVDLATAQRHAETISSDGIAKSLGVSSTMVHIVDIKKTTEQDECELVYYVRASGYGKPQTDLCTKMEGNKFHDTLQLKIANETGINNDTMTVSITKCIHTHMMVPEGTGTMVVNITSPPKYIPIIPYVDRNGVETVKTPKHVFKHNKELDSSPVTLTECPKGNRGTVCSGNGICGILQVGTEDPTKNLVEKICYCKPGYYGKGCGKYRCNQQGIFVRGGMPARDVPCGEHGVCKKDHNRKNPTCVCDEGYSGAGCEVQVCKGPQGKCNNHGVCKEFNGAPTCYCEPGRYGDACEFEFIHLPTPTKIHNLRHEPMIPDVHNASCRAMEINADGLQLEASTCFGHGLCMINNMTGKPSCQCDDTYAGTLCTERVCSEQCAENGGECNQETGKCHHCPPNRYGDLGCEFQYCGQSKYDHLANRCYNNGKCQRKTGVCICDRDGYPDRNLCKDKPVYVPIYHSHGGKYETYVPHANVDSGFSRQPGAVGGSITETSVTIKATPAKAVDIRCGVYSYDLWDARPTASEVWQDIGNGGNISAPIEEYPKRISGTSNPHAPVVPLVIGTTLGAHKEIKMVVNGLKPSTAYNVYCVANENPKILSRKFSFATVNFSHKAAEELFRNTKYAKKTGPFIEQPKIESRGPEEVTFSATPRTSDKITCGIFSYSAVKPTADELYQHTGRNGAAKGTTNGPVVDVETYSTSDGPGTPIETSTVGGLSANTAYRLYCATNDIPIHDIQNTKHGAKFETYIPKVLSNEMLFVTSVKAPAVESGASGGAGKSGASGAS